MLKDELYPEAGEAVCAGWGCGGREHLQQQRTAGSKAERTGERWSRCCKLFTELWYAVPERLGQEARQGAGAEPEDSLGF